MISAISPSLLANCLKLSAHLRTSFHVPSIHGELFLRLTQYILSTYPQATAEITPEVPVSRLRIIAFGRAAPRVYALFPAVHFMMTPDPVQKPAQETREWWSEGGPPPPGAKHLCRNLLMVRWIRVSVDRHTLFQPETTLTT